MLPSCSLCAPRYLVPILLHAKVGAAMLHEHVRLQKGLWVQQKLHSLPGCQLTLQHIKKKFLCIYLKEHYGVKRIHTMTQYKFVKHQRFCHILCN